jgi:hypothetical protein
LGIIGTAVMEDRQDCSGKNGTFGVLLFTSKVLRILLVSISKSTLNLKKKNEGGAPL